MSRAVEQELLRVFSHAERRGACVVPADNRLRHALIRRVGKGLVVRVARNMYARKSRWAKLDPSQRSLEIIRTLQGLHPDWIFCRESAALVLGLPVQHARLNVVHVIAPSKSRHGSTAGAVRWHRNTGGSFVVRRGIKVSSPEKTAFDCMRTSDFRQALAIADALLRTTRLSSAKLAARFRTLGRHHPGVRQAARTLLHADPRSESAGESIARAVMIENGVALPQLQAKLANPLDPRRHFRVDFLWTRADGSHVIGEFDGMQKYEDPAMTKGRSGVRVLAREQHREAVLTLYRAPIVRFSYRDVMDSASFVGLLKRYGVPHSSDVARTERRLSARGSFSAVYFAIV